MDKVVKNCYRSLLRLIYNYDIRKYDRCTHKSVLNHMRMFWQ